MGIVRSIKNVANGYSTVQVLVRKATSNDATGPTTYEMEQISSYTFQSQTDFLEIMDMLDRRLNDKGKNWRHVAKSLTVLDYLVRFGSEKCVMWAKDNVYIVKTLREFVHFDESNNDQGAIIRVKAKELVTLLRDDERLQHERELARNNHGSRRNNNDDDFNDGGRNNRNGNRRNGNNNEAPYDAELERALELSRITAQQENQHRVDDGDDNDLQAALKLSMEEEEMRKLKLQQNDNLLDLDDQQPQYFMATGYQQPQQYVQYQQQQPMYQQQYDMFGNPIQNPMMTGYQQPQYTQFQQQPQPMQQPTFTGFNYQAQQQQPQQELTPLKTGSNNPFAMNQSKPQEPTQPSLNDLSQNFFTQPQPQPQQQQVQKPLDQQNTSSSKFGNHSHPELNNLLALGTGIDTFGNTGDTRVAHHYNKSASMLTSNYTGIQTTDRNLAPASTGNPFLNPQSTQQQPQFQPQQQPHQQPAYTGYGFGNQPQKDGPSLIDI